MGTWLHRDFKDFLKLLNSEQVQYLIIGGYAVAHHGYPRTTADLDVWVSDDPENSVRTEKALRKFGAPPGEDIVGALAKGKVLRFGLPPVRLEIMAKISGVRFEKSLPRSEKADFDGVPVLVIGIADLLRNKKAANRPKDVADIAALSEVGRHKKRRER